MRTRGQTVLGVAELGIALPIGVPALGRLSIEPLLEFVRLPAACAASTSSNRWHHARPSLAEESPPSRER